MNVPLRNIILKHFFVSEYHNPSVTLATLVCSKIPHIPHHTPQFPHPCQQSCQTRFLLIINDFSLFTPFWHTLCALIGQKQQNNNKIKRHDYEKVFSLRRNGHGSSHSE